MKWNLPTGLTNQVDDAVVLDDDGNPIRPVFIGYACACLALTVIALLAVPVVGLAYTDELKRQIVSDNAHLTKPKVPFTAHDVAQVLGQRRGYSVFLGLCLAVMFGVLMYSMFKGKGWPRWVLIVTGLFTYLPFYILAIVSSRDPLPVRLPTTIAGAAYLAALSLLFIVPSRAYFKANRDIFRAELDSARAAAARSKVVENTEDDTESDGDVTVTADENIPTLKKKSKPDRTDVPEAD